MTYRGAEAIRTAYNEKKPALDAILDRIVLCLKENTETVRYVDSISGRVKAKESLVAKYLSKPEKYPSPFIDIEDVLGVRILVLFPSVSLELSERICSGVFPPVESGYRKDESPKSFGYEGYQSLHSIPADICGTTYSDQPRVFELQIRTLFQHAFAEPEHELNYKASLKLSDDERFMYQKRFSWLSATSWGADRILQELYEAYSRSANKLDV